MDRSSVNTLNLPLCKATKKKREETLERRTTGVTRAPPTATEGAGLMFCMRSCGWVPRCEQSALKGCSADTFLCSPVTLDWTERRGSRGSCGLRGALPTAPSSNVFVLYCTHQVHVSHHPFAFRASENPCRCLYLTSVQMHLFEKRNETLTYLE